MILIVDFTAKTPRTQRSRGENIHFCAGALPNARWRLTGANGIIELLLVAGHETTVNLIASGMLG